MFLSGKIELKVGKRGEIYTTREVREKTGITPGGEVIASIEQGRLILRPKPTVVTLLKKPRIDAEPISPEGLSKFRRELAYELETR